MATRTERKRTVASAVTYRVTSTVLLAGISWVATGQWEESLVVTVAFAFLATVLYYFNDRAWERSDWGRKGEVPRVPGPTSVRASPRATPSMMSELVPLQHEFLEQAS